MLYGCKILAIISEVLFDARYSHCSGRCQVSVSFVGFCMVSVCV